MNIAIKEKIIDPKYLFMKKLVLLILLIFAACSQEVIESDVENDETLELNVQEIEKAEPNTELTIKDILGDWKIKAVSTDIQGERQLFECDGEVNTLNVSDSLVLMNDCYLAYGEGSRAFIELSLEIGNYNEKFYELKTNYDFSEYSYFEQDTLLNAKIERVYRLLIISKELIRIHIDQSHEYLGEASNLEVYVRN